MSNFKNLTGMSVIVIGLMSSALLGQVRTILATADGRNFTAADLSPESRSVWENREEIYRKVRRDLLSRMVAETVLELEAKVRNTTSSKLVSEAKRRISDPTEAQIKAVYDANIDKLGNKTLEEVRNPIIEFIRREPEQNAVRSLVETLAAKYRVAYITDVNAAELKPGDQLFRVGTKAVTAREYDNKFQLDLYDSRADIYDEVQADLESVILTTLVSTEAAAQKVETSALIAREVTDRMRSFTDEERADLENALKHRLFDKYKVKFLIEPPRPVIQNISVDDDPSRGPANAPVTVVMFGDFQCSACARTYPVLQKVIANFPGKVRFVARDFPLENIHRDAFIAAAAAGAANAQGRFFEFSELLYRNQDSLDAASLKKYAAQTGLNVPRFELDFTAERTAAEIRKDVADGLTYGVSGTPTIFVNGVKVRRLSAEDFREAIENALQRTASSGSISP